MRPLQVARNSARAMMRGCAPPGSCTSTRSAETRASTSQPPARVSASAGRGSVSSPSSVALRRRARSPVSRAARTSAAASSARPPLPWRCLRVSGSVAIPCRRATSTSAARPLSVGGGPDSGCGAGVVLSMLRPCNGQARPHATPVPGGVQAPVRKLAANHLRRPQVGFQPDMGFDRHQCRPTECRAARGSPFMATAESRQAPVGTNADPHYMSA